MPSRPSHFEIPVDDPDRAEAFYATVFGWTFQRYPGAPQYYGMASTGESEPGINGALFRGGAASVKAYDAVVAMGGMKDYMPYEFPAVIGQDVAGVVEAAGESVDGFAPGDRVFGTMGLKGVIHDGGFGQLATPQAAA